MFRGFDRAKYDLKDPSAWTALQRDRALHEQALKTIERHLKASTVVQIKPKSALVTQLSLPVVQRADQLPESVRNLATQTQTQAVLTKALSTEKKIWPHS